MATSSPSSALPVGASPSIPRLQAAAAGVIGAGVGLGIAEMLAGAFRRLQSPVISVGDRVVDFVPGFLKDIAIELFGTNDKIALLVGIGSILLAYAAAVGLTFNRFGPKAGAASIALFAAIGSLAALGDRAGASWWAVFPSIIGSLVAAATIWWLIGVGRTGSAAEPGGIVQEIPSGRRRFIAHAGAFAFAGVATAAVGRQLNARFSVEKIRSALQLPSPRSALDPVPQSAMADGAAPFLTPTADFYRIDTALAVPQIDPTTWSLRVHGMVDKEITLTYEDLLDRDFEEFDITMTCVSNVVGGGLIGTARWLGTRLDDLLEEAGIDSAANQIVGRSADGYTCGFPVNTLDGRNAIVAVGMNGEALPADHGFPARLVVPGLYGYVSATKWLTELELTTFDAFDHYWVPRGYAAEAPIKMQSRIDSPRGLQRIDPGPFAIGGVAWNQTIGISGVEIKIDDGPWMAAEMADAVNDEVWRQWTFPWDAQPGRHSITARAISADGAIQTDERSEPLPDGASGLHTTVVLVNETGT